MKKKLTLTALALSLSMASQPIAQANGFYTWSQRSLEDVIASVQGSLSAEVDYEVQWGDTLYSIAQALDMSVLEIAALNRIENPDLIIAGSTITFNKLTHTVTINDEITYSSVNGQEVSQVESGLEELATASEMLETEAENLQESVNLSPVSEPVLVETTAVTEKSTVEEESADVIPETTEEVVEEVVPASPIIEAPVLELPSYEVPTTEAPTTEPETTEEVTSAVETTEAPVTTGLSAYEAFEVITSQYNISAAEKDMWSEIITRESGWNPTISNSYSGAYGLPQALPGSKMASHGEDWATNPYTQLAWMYDYMVGRYGSITGAYQHSINMGWY